MKSEGIIPIQAGSNKYASQKGMTGFGRPRDVIDKVKAENIKEITDEKKIEALKASTWLQSGTNKFASQKGQSAFGAVRDVNYKTKGTGGASEVPEEKARASDGIVPLQSGTNKLASQAGMTGIGMPRIVDGEDFYYYHDHHKIKILFQYRFLNAFQISQNTSFHVLTRYYEILNI